MMETRARIKVTLQTAKNNKVTKATLSAVDLAMLGSRNVDDYSDQVIMITCGDCGRTAGECANSMMK
jgi:hypothetical protein